MNFLLNIYKYSKYIFSAPLASSARRIILILYLVYGDIIPWSAQDHYVSGPHSEPQNGKHRSCDDLMLGCMWWHEIRGVELMICDRDDQPTALHHPFRTTGSDWYTIRITVCQRKSFHSLWKEKVGYRKAFSLFCKMCKRKKTFVLEKLEMCTLFHLGKLIIGLEPETQPFTQDTFCETIYEVNWWLVNWGETQPSNTTDSLLKNIYI